MARRWNHYDLAFEMYLRSRGIPYVSVDETRRALLAQASLKSMDYIVYGPGGRNLLVEVKGRKAKTTGLSENWVTADDLASLRKWEGVFGGSFRAVMVFAYDVSELVTPLAAVSRAASSPATSSLATSPLLEAPSDLCAIEPAAEPQPGDARFHHRGRDYTFQGVWMEEYERQVKVRSPRWETLWAPAAAFRAVRFPIEDFLAAPETLAS